MKMKAWGIFVGHCTVSTQHTMVEVTMQESGYEPSVFHISYFMLKTGGFAKIISNRDLKIIWQENDKFSRAGPGAARRRRRRGNCVRAVMTGSIIVAGWMDAIRSRHN